MNIPTLESVQADFHHWREQRPSRRSPTPTALRSKALSLRDQHSVNAICIALGITRRMLLDWQRQMPAERSSASEPTEFVMLPAEAESPRGKSEHLQVSLTQASGDHWCLSGNPSAEQLQSFVSALSGGSR